MAAAGMSAHTASATALQHPPRQVCTELELWMQLQSVPVPALRHATVSASADMQLLVRSPRLLSSQPARAGAAAAAAEATGSSTHTASATALQHPPRQICTELEIWMQLQSVPVPALRHATVSASADMQLLVKSPRLLSSQAMPLPGVAGARSGGISVWASSCCLTSQIALKPAPRQAPRQSCIDGDLRMQSHLLPVSALRHAATSASADVQLLIRSPSLLPSQPVWCSSRAGVAAAGMSAHTASATALQHPPRQVCTELELWMQLQSVPVSALRHATVSASADMQLLVKSPRLLSSQPVGAVAAAAEVADASVHTESATAPQQEPRQSRTAPDLRMQLQSLSVPC